MTLVPASSHGGLIAVAPVSVQTNINTFTIAQVYTVNGPALAVMLFQPTVLTPDGETFGTAGGNIAVNASAEVSDDGVSYTGFSGANHASQDSNGYLSLVTNFEETGGFVSTYLRLTVSIIAVTGGLTYAGANHPRCTGTISMRAQVL